MARPEGVVQLYGSTTTLFKTAFSEYMQKIERDTGVIIPEGERNDLLKDMAIDVRHDESYPEDPDRLHPTIWPPSSSEA